MHLLAFLLFGLIVGAIARWIVPGKEPGGWIASLLIGVAGAMLGGLLRRITGPYGEGDAPGLVMSLFGAIVLAVVYHAMTLRRRGVV
jgi:uncharacterized membrane protein YeaQ/YmgE (transglycosylase-associated protein family)